MILHSKVDVTFNMKHLFGLLGYWLLSAIAFIFPWGIMAATLLDMTIILGLPIFGAEAPTTHDAPILS